VSLPVLFRIDDRLRIERIPLHLLTVERPHAVEQHHLDYLREILAQAPDLDHAPLIVVPRGGTFAIIDGKKRFIAALSEGRPDIFCLIKEDAL
jgi:hypothetical protein